ncbi:type-F conjugative transfer system secretin TraK [Sphingobium sp. AN558]|uniref:type-F conjugative transfer system secretin TraK n=1 Tax=Sphingobium sp. AN558 TaxID=3133442 RepID=UPI004040B784
MAKFSKARRAAMLACGLVLTGTASAQTITVLPEQTATIRLSNRDVNHLICDGGEIEDVRFSAEKGLAVERGGADAWIKFLVKETDDLGAVTRSYVTTPSEFFVTCNGAIYPLYAEPTDIPAQTVRLAPGKSQRARANESLLGPLVEEERAVSVSLALLQDRVPASFTERAPAADPIILGAAPGLRISERRHILIEGAALSASEYLVQSDATVTLDERLFLDAAFGTRIFGLTIDRLDLRSGETARLIVVRQADRL